jgi:cystathionine beta-lyase/cystathionine gamma-synthase
MVFIETPTNPLMILADLKKISKICKSNKLIHVVDNTFMTPFFQNPLDLGADIVVHSTTKYLNGHSDSLGGAVITSNKRFAEKIKFFQKSAGAVLSPFESWMILRGIKTLPLRMERHDQNGRKVAQYLSNQKKVKNVFYPGLSSHPQYRLGKKQMRGFGGMVTFDVGSYRNAKKLLEALRLCALAGSLGGVETLISHPSSMTHTFASAQEKKRVGITDGLVRISVGIEDVEDIIRDLDRGFKAV